MTNYREILRLSSLQYSQRTIESMAHCSRHTVRDVLQAAKEQGISWPLSDDVANADLEQLLFPNRHKASSQYAEPDYPYIHRELARSGVTLTLLWEEYCAKCQEAGQRPYMSTQFGERYRRWARITKATMRIQHKPGDAMQVDWAGDTIPLQDPVTGEQSAAYLFVAVLPCSYYTYAEACDDMKTENWLNCHVHAFDYFGGVARLLIPDNCKTATLSNTQYDVILNRSYQKLAEHYGSRTLSEVRQGSRAGIQGLRRSDQTGTAVRQTAAGGSLRQNSGVQHHALAAHHCQHSEKWPGQAGQGREPTVAVQSQ